MCIRDRVSTQSTWGQIILQKKEIITRKKNLQKRKMTTQKMDFVYDHHDATILRAAYDEFREDEHRGFYLGLGVWALSYAGLRSTFGYKKGLTGIASFIFGVSAYNLWTHKSRTYYARYAQQVNSNVSRQINYLMDYPDKGETAPVDRGVQLQTSLCEYVRSPPFCVLLHFEAYNPPDVYDHRIDC
eukprot:TRINITY_DN253_c0_g1_i4.p1 TRINITY_DN253_c0_g1~~TRINITY_DN253_c0_g1_i4.p1  ORF type:complete len:186 (+),score=49.78 TRINITY_DN253_c0_g1_i4:66-623(+)